MRVLLLLRGAPGCGKTTYIKENGLEQYALSADGIRMLYQSPVMTVDGSFNIAQTNEKEVWDTLFRILEARMLRGEFVVIDATNSKTKEMNRYKDMASTYRYRIYCVDFTDIPIVECKRRNRLRPEYKQVPDEAIEKMYSRFVTQDIPSGIKVLKPDELSQIWFRPLDFSSYKRIHHIGDIHGCYTALMEYLKDGLKDDELYIFCGDYIDRGIENVEVINFLASICERRNVILLEGNHERWLWYWSHGGTAKSKEFEVVTRPALERGGLDPKVARVLYRKLGQCAYYTYGDRTIFACHAGLSRIPDNLTLIATEQMIRGVGYYSEYKQVAESFERLTPENFYQLFGHRNTEDSPVHMSQRCFNLEGHVEFGGMLRVVTLDADGFHEVEVKNNVFKPANEQVSEAYTPKELSVMEIVDLMRQNRYIMEKKFGNISSFNFTREAFYDKKWNDQTVKARGLFIDTAAGKIAARSYEKFFQINERPETKLEMLPHRLKFPVTAYVKENGFLGIISYDEANDDLFIASKSTPEGPFAGYVRTMFDGVVSDREAFKQYVKENNVSFVFECVDMENDPHIIKYDRSHLFLLDVIKNDMAFEKLPYSDLVQVAKRFGFEVKTKAITLQNWNEFRSWYDAVMDEDYRFDGKHIEGFVVEDAVGFMMKVKLEYYRFWKHMRTVAQETLRSGNYRRTGELTTPMANHFFGFCKEIRNEENHPTHIIPLREAFLSAYGKQDEATA